MRREGPVQDEAARRHARRQFCGSERFVVRIGLVVREVGFRLIQAKKEVR